MIKNWLMERRRGRASSVGIEMSKQRSAAPSDGRGREKGMPPQAGAIIGTHAGVVLRHARDEDAVAIVSLVSTVWSEYPGKILNAAADMPELLAPASAYAACAGCFWVVEANGEIIGTVALKPIDEDVVELQKLYV